VPPVAACGRRIERAGAGFATAHDGDLNAETGVYHGIDTPGGNGPRNILQAIVADAISTTIPILDGFHAITFEDTAIPESGAVVLIGLGLGLLRRRKG